MRLSSLEKKYPGKIAMLLKKHFRTVKLHLYLVQTHVELWWRRSYSKEYKSLFWTPIKHKINFLSHSTYYFTPREQQICL